MAKNNTERATVKLIIDGRQAETSIKEVRQAMIGLERQLVKMKRADDPAGYDEMVKELNKLTQAHSQMVQEMRGGASSWQRFKTDWKEIALGSLGGNLAMSAINAVQQGFRRLITKSGELSDSLSDVQKQTGLAGQDLEELNAALQQMDTRTSTQQLRELAAVAGKLGYQSKEDVLAFVRAADIINVALGKDLGGNVEEAINDIGKLTEIFGIKEEFGIEQSMLKTASAINTLGASSAANEAYMVAWAKRFGGIAPNAGISIADTLGLAASMDILGQSSELSATNLGKMILEMGKNVPHFSKVAGMSVEDFSSLLKTDANEAFLRVIEGAKSTEKGVEGLAKMFETLGIEGSEGAQVLGALANNTKLVRIQQESANKSYKEGVSAINEYTIKNNNSAAVLDKIAKRLDLLWEKAAASMNPLIEMFGEWVGVVDELSEGMAKIEAQQAKVNSTEKDLVPLIERYDQLATNTKRSRDEQIEFAHITQQIADAVPGATTVWDQYGNALQVNTFKARDFVAEQRALLETMRQTRKEMLVDNVQDLQKRANQIQNTLKRGTSIRTVEGPGGYSAATNQKDLTNAEIKAMQSELASIQAEIKKSKEEWHSLNGKPVASKAGTQNDTTKKTTKTSDDTSKPPKPPGPDSKNTLEDLNKKLREQRQQLSAYNLSQDQKEINDTLAKYDELREMAMGNKQKLTEIAELEQMELAQIREKYRTQNMEAIDRNMRNELKLLSTGLKEENDYYQQRAAEDQERQDAELAKIREDYGKKIADAQRFGADVTGYYIMMHDEIQNLQLSRNIHELEEEKKHTDELVKEEKERNDKLKEEKRKALEDDLRMIDAKRQAYTSIMEGIGNLFAIMAENESDYAEFKKVLGIAQLAIDTGAAIASAVRVAAQGSLKPIELIASIAATISLVTANILKAKQLLTKTEIPEPPAFRAKGGYTDMASLSADPGGPEGWVSRPTLFSYGKRRYVAGERGREYVISNAMLKNPAIADFVGMVEGLRHQNAFTYPMAQAQAQSNSSNTTPAMDQKLDETNRLLRELVNKPDQWNYNAFENYRDLVNDIRRRASA